MFGDTFVVDLCSVACGDSSSNALGRCRILLLLRFIWASGYKAVVLSNQSFIWAIRVLAFGLVSQTNRLARVAIVIRDKAALTLVIC